MAAGAMADACKYGPSECRCAGAKDKLTWECAASPVCPPMAPTAGAACDPEHDPGKAAACKFGDATCACEGRMGKAAWSCVVCPAAAPATGAACDHEINRTCRYDAADCKCGMDDEWACQEAP